MTVTDDPSPPEPSRLARFDALFIAYQRPVLAYAMRRAPTAADAEDVTAETFTTAWRKFEAIPFDEPLPFDGVATWLEVLATTRGADVLRVKGILDLIGEDRPVVVHGVQHVFHPPQLLAAWPEGGHRRSRIVFIVRGLRRETVETGMNAFIASARERIAVGAAG